MNPEIRATIIPEVHCAQMFGDGSIWIVEDHAWHHRGLSQDLY